MSRLREAKRQGLLAKIPGNTVNETLAQLMNKAWVVYTKAVTYGHDKLVDYLGRYTRRIALTPNRLLKFKDNEVSLQYRDYHDGKRQVMTLTSEELLRRYALHVLPKRFMGVRYHGFLANAVRAEKLIEIRSALKVMVVPSSDESAKSKGAPDCPDCGQNHWHYIGVYLRQHWHPG